VGAPGHGHFTHRTDGLTQGGFHCVLAKYFASGFGRFSCALRSNRNSILMLALGMCASMAIFAFVDAALIKPFLIMTPDGWWLYLRRPSCARVAMSRTSIFVIGSLECNRGICLRWPLSRSCSAVQLSWPAISPRAALHR